MGITFGYGDGDYCPGDLVSRAQIASFLARAFELTEGGGINAFSDDNGSVHEANINRMAYAGVTYGCGGTNYCPSAYLNRAQFASLLIRALEDLMGADYSAAEGANYFVDDNGSVHEPNIDKLRYAGVTSGCGGPNYCPGSYLTRGQLAALLHRALG